MNVLLMKAPLIITLILTLLLLPACHQNYSDNTLIISLPSEQHLLTSRALPNKTNDTTLFLGESVELILNEPATQIQWQQLDGPTVTFLSPNQNIIAFTTQNQGDYSFEVSYTNKKNLTMNQQVSFSVSNEQAPFTTRLGHSVVEGNNVSLKVWQNTTQLSPIIWRQLTGPTVIFDDDLTNTSTNEEVFFKAPEVDQNTLISFEVSSANSTYIDIISLIVTNGRSISHRAYFKDRVSDVFPFNVNAPYAQSIVGCVYSNQLSSSCQLKNLPLIAMENDTATVDDIMNRVVVSHRWMGERFKAFLTSEDPNNDFKFLLSATTAIVIAYDIRPSFYWAATGAIYLDPSVFWLTADERDTINQQADYRANFSNDLNFVMPWRYVKDNQYAWKHTDIAARDTRTTSDRLYKLTNLLYHELAHANDFFPSSKWQTYSANSRVIDAATATSSQSDHLSVTYPLNSKEMKTLAQISFHGESADELAKSYHEQDVSVFFGSDHANDYYNYSSSNEDFAMLFEELLMQARYEVYRDVAITNRPQGDNITAADYIVSWGQRGRIGEQTIKARALLTAQSILPIFDSQSYIDSISPPILMAQGQSWYDNLILNAQQSKTTKQAKANPVIVDENILEQRYYHKALPKH